MCSIKVQDNIVNSETNLINFDTFLSMEKEFKLEKDEKPNCKT